MSNIPVKPIQLPLAPLSKPTEAAAGDQVQSSSPTAPASNDAASVSVPRTQIKGTTLRDPTATLESLLDGMRSGEDVTAAHGGLDIDRVLGLLGDGDDKSNK